MIQEGYTRKQEIGEDEQEDNSVAIATEPETKKKQMKRRKKLKVKKNNLGISGLEKLSIMLFRCGECM